MRKTRGFTLVEVLVVLLVMSIVTVVAMLTIGRHDTRVMRSMAEELTQSFHLAEEQAMLAPAVLGFKAGPTTWQFYTLTNEAHPTWEPLEDTAFPVRSIPEGVVLSWHMLGSTAREADNLPAIIFSNNGDVTPFELSISKRGQHPAFIIKGEADGTITAEGWS